MPKVKKECSSPGPSSSTLPSCKAKLSAKSKMCKSKPAAKPKRRASVQKLEAKFLKQVKRSKRHKCLDGAAREAYLEQSVAAWRKRETLRRDSEPSEPESSEEEDEEKAESRTDTSSQRDGEDTPAYLERLRRKHADIEKNCEVMEMEIQGQADDESYDPEEEIAEEKFDKELDKPRDRQETTYKSHCRVLLREAACDYKPDQEDQADSEDQSALVGEDDEENKDHSEDELDKEESNEEDEEKEREEDEEGEEEDKEEDEVEDDRAEVERALLNWMDEEVEAEATPELKKRQKRSNLD